MRNGRWIFAVLAALAVGAAGLAEAREVHRCGITIKRGQTGTLSEDVQCGWHCGSDPTVRCVVETPGDDPDCPLSQADSCEPDVITLENNATLDLNGFTLTTVYGETGIVCSEGPGKCTIEGPGTVLGGKSATPIFPGDKNLVLRDLTIRRFYRVIRTTGTVRATNVALAHCEGGLLGEKGLRASNVSLESQCSMHSGRDLLVDGASSQGWLGAGRNARLKNVFSAHVGGKNVFLTNSVAEARFDAPGKVVLRGSTVGEFESGLPPKVVNSTCTRSFKPDDSTWGVCADD